MNAPIDERLSARETLLVHYWYVLKKRWISIAVFWSLLTASVVVGTLMSTKYYASTAVIEIAPEAPEVMKVDEVSEVGSNAIGAGIRAYYATQYRILKSRTVLAEAARRLREEHGVTDLDHHDQPADLLGAYMVLTPESETHLVNITFEYPDPDRAALFANTVAEVYMDRNLERQASASLDALDFLETQRADYRQRKHDADQRVHAFVYQNHLAGADEDREATVEAMQTARAAWGRVRADRLVVETDYHHLARALRHTGWRVAATQLADEDLVLREMVVELQALEQRESVLAARYLPEHPDRLRARAELDALQDRIRRQLAQIVQARRAQMDRLTARELALSAELDALNDRRESLDAQLIELELLESEASRDELFYRNLDQRMSEVDLSKTIQANNVRFVDRALSDDHPIRPVMSLNVLMALALGLMGGCAMAFFREYLDATVKNREDVEDVIGVPFTGVVPLIAQEHLDELPDERDRNVYVNARPRSAVAECLRSIRTNVLFNTRSRPIKRLVVTSAVPREGKSFISCNLGALIAMTGSRVLLIDADLRRPSQHRLFVTENDLGLADVLAERVPLERAIRPSHVSGLDLLIAGPYPGNPAELLGSGRMERLLDSVAGYDVVIVDSPPVNVVSDPLMLAALADGVLVVIEANHTSRSLVRQVRARLEEMNANILGAVVNKLDVSRAGYGYHYYYDDGYHYYSGEEAEVG